MAGKKDIKTPPYGDTNEGLALCTRLKHEKNLLKGYKSKETFCTG